MGHRFVKDDHYTIVVPGLEGLERNWEDFRGLRKSKGLTSIWQIDVEEVRLAPPTFQTVVSFGCSVSDAKK